MHRFTTAELAEATGGVILGDGAPGARWALNTDSRSLAPGEIFVALKGLRFDGNDFLAEALKVEGCGVLGETPRVTALTDARWAGRPRVGVADGNLALGHAARWLRRRMDIPVVAVTGSAGKTTTRELIRCVLAAALGEVLATRGNLNNHFGVPMTLLRLTEAHRGAVLELGMSAAGEIAYLAGIAEPTVRTITNVGAAHLETLRDEDGVARAKGELFATARPGDQLVVNLDDARVAALPRPAQARVVTFGRHPDAQVRLVDDPAAPDGAFRVAVGGRPVDVELRLPGAHNRLNATCALAVAAALGLDLEVCAPALRSAEIEPMRMERHRLSSGAVMINDAYNANPQSMAAALGAARGMVPPGGRLVAVLGDMLELGPRADLAHRALGRRLGEVGVARLFAAGPRRALVAEGAEEAGLGSGAVTLGEDADALIAPVLGEVGAGDVVLIKGSRSMRMERVARALLAASEGR